jgi:hypothetical protein
MRILLAIFILLFSGFTFAEEEVDMEELAKLGAGYHAKNMCTCLFVVEQTEEFCKDMSKTTPNIDDFGGEYIIDREKKSVTAKIIIVQATAQWKDERLGCLLTPAQMGGE